MSTANSLDSSAPFTNGGYRIASYHVGKSLVDIVRGYFPSGKIRRGDYYFDRSRPMILEHYDRLEPQDQSAVQNEFAK